MKLQVMITIFIAMCGMLSPSSRGALVSAAFVLFMFMGLFCGFFAGRLFKTIATGFNIIGHIVPSVYLQKFSHPNLK